MTEETLSLSEMQTLVDQLKVGSAILYNVLQEVFHLHDVNEEEKCTECEVAYPCKTVQILLEQFVVSQPQPGHQDQQ